MSNEPYRRHKRDTRTKQGYGGPDSISIGLMFPTPPTPRAADKNTYY